MELNNFKKNSLIKILAIIQIVCFIITTIVTFNNVFSNVILTSLVLGIVYAIGGSPFGMGVATFIASLVLLFTKKENVYNKARKVFIVCFLVNFVLFGLFALVVANMQW